MKYEYLCGHVSDFFTMPENVIAVVRLDHCVQGLTEFNQITGCGKPVLAMRRIIAEPKRWTVEDKKAGRLPDVGCIVEYFNNNEHDNTEVTAQWRNGDELEILRHQNKNKAFVVFNARAERSSDLIVQCMKPIETPKEKAQREEDEFVNELMKDSQVIYTSSEQLAMCRKTARAAYRKLSGALSVPAKGGE